jgi:hypothetical protein
VSHELVVDGQGGAHLLPMRFPQARRTLHISEEEGHGPGRNARPHPYMVSHCFPLSCRPRSILPLAEPTLIFLGLGRQIVVPPWRLGFVTRFGCLGVICCVPSDLFGPGKGKRLDAFGIGALPWIEGWERGVKCDTVGCAGW